MAVFLLGGGVALIVVAFLLAYLVIFPTSSPKPFKLTTSKASSTTSAATTAGAAPQTTSATGFNGTWKVTSGSLAGYRVREKLGFLPAQSDAVGRTSQITGGVTFSESKSVVTISAASFDVAVNTLKSDRSMRDEKIHDIGLESNRYPTATFALSRPLTVSASALYGKVTRLSVTGTFNIHGVAKSETLPVELTLSGSIFEAAGSFSFPWSEFGMTAPSIGGFVNVARKSDDGIRPASAACLVVHP